MPGLETVRQAAAALADTANGIACAGSQRAIVLRLPTARRQWNTFAESVRAAADGAPPAPADPDPLPNVAEAESQLDFWESTLRELSKRARTKGFLVTYDVWAAPATAKGGDGE